jgi:hypothetical protein
LPWAWHSVTDPSCSAVDEHCDFEVRRGERGDLLSFGFIRAARALGFPSGSFTCCLRRRQRSRTYLRLTCLSSDLPNSFPCLNRCMWFWSDGRTNSASQDAVIRLEGCLPAQCFTTQKPPLDVLQLSLPSCWRKHASVDALGDFGTIHSRLAPP